MHNYFNLVTTLLVYKLQFSKKLLHSNCLIKIIKIQIRIVNFNVYLNFYLLK